MLALFLCSISLLRYPYSYVMLTEEYWFTVMMKMMMMLISGDDDEFGKMEWLLRFIEVEGKQGSIFIC